MMFISKFNRLIRNKVLWSAFAFMVVVSFVAWTTRTGGRRSGQENQVGRLDGKLVTPEEFQSAYFNSFLSMSLMIGRPLKVTERVNQALRNMAWRRLVALRAAKAMDIPVTGEEVVTAIRQQPYFYADGQFRPERYEAFVNRFLSSLQTSEAQFEEHIRQEILLNKARYLLAQAVWISPQETEQIFHQLYDTFVVSYVFLSQDDVEATVKISDEQAKAYFEGHPEQFKIPEKMSVKVVAFPMENFLDEGSLDEETLRSYYEEHIEDFTTKGTNDLLTAVPFEAVEDKLREMLAWEAAAAQAGDKASDFEVVLAPDRQGQAPSFEEAAGAAGLTVSISTLFSVEEGIPGLKAGLDFSKAAFDLRATPEDYFSHPLKGKDAYYILAYDRKVDARIPAFDEVKQEAVQAATEEAVAEKLEQMAKTINEAVTAAVEKGISFSKVFESSGLEVVTTEPFSVKEGLDDNEFDHFYVLVKQALSLDANELTGMIPVKNGVIFAYVDLRIPASRTIFESVKNDLGRYIKNKRESIAFTDWQEYLLASAKFEDLSPKRQAAGAPQEEEVPEDVE